DAANQFVALVRVPSGDGGVPQGGIGGGLECNVKQAGSSVENALLHAVIGEVGTHGLRIEAEGGASVLFVLIEAAVSGERGEVGVFLAGEREHEGVLGLGGIARGGVDVIQK